MKVHGIHKSTATQRVLGCLCKKDRKPLLPGFNKTMAVLELWKKVEAHQFNPPSTKLVFELRYKPHFGMTIFLDVYEAHLAESKYLACDHFTLVDLHYLPNKLFDSKPYVSTWVADITSRLA
uniref:glutathione transferase n=1 Tax=Gossypium raimondii TaxID=29730 RepID=A0A0D2MRB0_GOSRA|nr:hypothetical protein B456_004G141800 [Gossypium raimondii]